MNQIKARDFFLRAILLIVILATEFLVCFLDAFVDGRDTSQLVQFSKHWYAMVSHWIITLIIWGTGITLLYRWSKKKGVLNELLRFNFTKRTSIMLFISILIVLLVSFIEAKIFKESIPQVYQGFKIFVKMYGSKAFIVTIFQNIYYFVESIMVLFIIAFFQRAGELWFKKETVPWGGIGLSLTWGLLHFIAHPTVALYISIWALFLGVMYILNQKNVYPTFAVIFLMFII